MKRKTRGLSFLLSVVLVAGQIAVPAYAEEAVSGNAVTDETVIEVTEEDDPVETETVASEDVVDDSTAESDTAQEEAIETEETAGAGDETDGEADDVLEAEGTTWPDNTEVRTYGENTFYVCCGCLIGYETTGSAGYVTVDLSDLQGIITQIGGRVSLDGGNAMRSYEPFSGMSTLKEVTIPESVISIYDGAFSNCTLLTTVEFAENSNLTDIGEDAFRNCTALSKINLENTKLKNIGEMAFYENDGLAGIDLSGIELESIGRFAFRSCDKLTSVKLPGTVDSIGESAFASCGQLQTVTMDANSPIKNIANATFYDCSNLKNIMLPDAVEIIGDSAFCGCTSLTTVPIDSDKSRLTTISSYAFENCINLKNVILPDSVETIGDYAFGGSTWREYNTALTSFVVPKNCKSIGECAFCGCTALTTLTIPQDSQLTTLGDCAFYNCQGLSNLTFPEKITSIGESAFRFINSNGTQAIIRFDNPDVILQADAFDDKEYMTFLSEEGGTVQAYADTTCPNIKFNRFSDSISVNALPTKTEYLYGDTFSADGIDVRAVYTSDAEKTPTSVHASECTFTGYSKNKIGAQKITVAYGGQKNTFDVKVYYDMSKATVSYIPSQGYTGKGVEPELTITGKESGVKLTKGVDYEVTYSNHVQPGTATATITGIGSYKGTISKTFTIDKPYIGDCEVIVEDTIFDGGDEQKPRVSVSYNGIEVDKANYKISYPADVDVRNVGEYSIMLEGRNLFGGYGYYYYEVLPASMDDVESVEIPAVTYSGSQQTPNMELYFGDYCLTDDDYSVSFRNNTVVGNATAIIKGKNNFAGTITKTFMINPLSMSNVTVDQIAGVEYNGNPQTPEPVVKYGTNVLKKDVDYTVSYENNTAVGTATIVISGINNCTGSITSTFTITSGIPTWDTGNDWDDEDDDQFQTAPVGTVASDTGKKTIAKVTGNEEGKLTVTYMGTTNKKSSTITIPDTVTISGEVYKVTTVDAKALKGNKNVKKVTVGNNVTAIGKDAFNGCTKLKTVTIGKNVSKIGANTFKGCKNLNTIVIKTNKLTSKSVAKNAFKGISAKTTIKVPKKKLKSYKKLFRSKGLSAKVKVKGF